MDYEAIAKEIWISCMKDIPTQPVIESILRAHFPVTAGAREEARDVARIISSIFGISRPQVSGDPGCDPALDTATERIEQYAVSRARLAQSPTPTQPKESIQLGIAENTRQDMLRQLPPDLAERLSTAHIMDVWMVVADRLIPKEPKESAKDAEELALKIAPIYWGPLKTPHKVINIVYNPSGENEAWWDGKAAFSMQSLGFAR